MFHELPPIQSKKPQKSHEAQLKKPKTTHVTRCYSEPMLERFGIKNRQDLATFLSLILLVALTPSGKEATHPIVLGVYRTLLLVIIAVYFGWTDRSRLPRLSQRFVAGLIGVAGLMLIAILRWEGSLFESFYLFYENILFAGAFIALAHSAAGRSTVWKNAVLGAVVLINAAYIAGTLVIGTRPLLGPFVNPNYLASFVLPGLAVCAATVLLGSSIRLRIGAAAAGLFLYYGIGQASSRGATLAGLVMLGLAAFRVARRHPVSLLRMGLASTLLLTITISFNTALVRKFMDRGEGDPYNYQRGKIWLASLQMIADHPVTGSGLG